MCRNLDYVSNSYRNHRILIRLVVLNVWTHPHIWDVVPSTFTEALLHASAFSEAAVWRQKGFSAATSLGALRCYQMELAPPPPDDLLVLS